MVVPTFATLLASAVLKMFSNFGPLFGSVLLDELEDLPVLGLSPGAFDNQLRRILTFSLTSIRMVAATRRHILFLIWYGTQLSDERNLLLLHSHLIDIRQMTICLLIHLGWP